MIAILLICVIGISLFLLYQHRNYWIRKGLISHVKPAPLFGNIFPIFISRSVSMPESSCQLYNLFPNSRYLGIMQFHTPVIVLRDPELIKDICIKDFDNFPDHESLIPENADPLLGKNLFFLQGEGWKQMRHTLTPTFTGSKMKFMFELVSKCSEDFVKFFLDHPEEANSVDMKDKFTRYANDVIATVAFGITVNSVQDRNNEFYLKGKDATNFNNFARTFKMLIIRYFTVFTKIIGETLVSRTTVHFFRTIIRETVKIRKEKNIVRPDMIQLLLEASQNEQGAQVSVDDIVAQAFIFYLAGFSTSATVMGFMAYELAVNTDIQEKLRKEVDHFVEEHGKISYDTLSKMKYLDMVISETLRKYPPNPVMDRLCVKKYTLPKATPESTEYTIEPKSMIWLPIYALHHDEKHFPNSLKFDPERFSEENKDKINPYVYIPFGVGPRKCIGNRFALMEIKILFVHLLQNFILERGENTEYPVRFEKGCVVAAEGEFTIKLKKRMSK